MPNSIDYDDSFKYDQKNDREDIEQSLNRAVIKRALEICIENLEDWPKDDWFDLNAYWDLNLWTNDSGACCAAIYPVRVNRTDTRGGGIYILKLPRM